VYGAGNDVRTPRAEIEALVQHLRGRQHPVEYMLNETQGHSLNDPATAAELSARTLRFLRTSLAINTAR